MNACSNSISTCSSMCSRLGSAAACTAAPARSSSQLLPHCMSIVRPVSAECECALGFTVPNGALINLW